MVKLRDIIYRGKDKHKKWHYGFYLKEKTIDGNVLSYIDRSDMLYNIDKVEVDPNTIQEYSGFTDKNKTRVFEGDILYKQGYWKYYVEFEDGAIAASLTGVAGNAETGRKVFANRKQGNCLACHQNEDLRAEPFHGEVGPSLDCLNSVVCTSYLNLAVTY